MPEPTKQIRLTAVGPKVTYPDADVVRAASSEATPIFDRLVADIESAQNVAVVAAQPTAQVSARRRRWFRWS